MSDGSASSAERGAPPYTFLDPGRGVYRPQFVTRIGSRSHPVLRNPDGSPVVREADVAAAMAIYCRELIDADVLCLTSKVARLYVGASDASTAEIIPIPLPPRAPPPAPDAQRKGSAPVPGCHGMVVLSIEVDHTLIAELTPDGSAAKIAVAPASAAAKAGLRTGDYVLSLGQSGRMVSLRDFDGLCLRAGAGILVRFHRPGSHRPREFDIKALTLRRLIGANRKTPPWWRSRPKGELGRPVERGKDRAAFVGHMAAHPHMPKTAFSLLARLASHYDGRQGAFPSYDTLAGDLGSGRRATAIENARCLEWLGVLDIRVGKGRAARTKGGLRRGGFSNRFVLHWPAVWPIEEKN